jgi:hypothetical protein
MSIGYHTQQGHFLIGSETQAPALTTSYGDNTYTLSVGRMTQAEFYLEYTPGENNGVLNVQIEMGPSESDLYKSVAQTVDSSTGIVTILPKIEQITGTVASTVYKYRLSEPVADRFLRISFKEDVSTTHGTLKAKVLMSGI